MLHLILAIAGLFFNVQSFEDGSAILTNDAITINVPAFDSSNDVITITLN